MNIEEYKFAIKKINAESDEKKKIVAREYAYSNNPYKIGDIITDHYQTIKIDKIAVTIAFTGEFPQCVYSGPKLKKDLTPYKSGERSNVYQPNIGRGE